MRIFILTSAAREGLEATPDGRRSSREIVGRETYGY